MKTDLTKYDVIPEDMKLYLSYNGPHFNKKLCNYAVGMMKSDNNIKLNPFKREDIDNMMKSYNIVVNNNELYDYVFVANMVKADFYGKSIRTEKDVCQYVKDYIDDPDGYDGIAFNRWLADCARKGIVINWEDYI